MEAMRNLRDLAARLRDLSPVLRVAGEELRTLSSDSFRRSREPGGAPWRPLAASTIARRRRGSSKPLLDTGLLANSITYRATRSGVTLGTSVPYAAPHQLGAQGAGRSRRVRIPARPFLPFDEAGQYTDRGPAAAVMRRIERMVAAYITTGRVE